MDSDNLIYIEPLNHEHRMNIGIALGLSHALRVLRDADPFVARLPGFNTAVALLEAVEAQHRAQTAGFNLRAAEAAGYNLATHKVGLIGAGRIFVEPMDLEELAQFAPDGGARGSK